MSRILAVGALPEGDETEDLFRLLSLADIGVGVAEGPPLGVLGQEGQDTGLAARARGNVVTLEDRVVAVVGNGVEIEVEGIAGEEVLPLHELMQGGEQTGILGRVDPGGVLGKQDLLAEGDEYGE